MTNKVQLIGRDAENYIAQILNQSLSDDESTTKQSFKVEIIDDSAGFFFVPRLPTSLIMNSNLYYKIYDIVSFAVYPSYTMIRASSMQLVERDAPISMARAFFFPWKIGISKRLVGSIGDIFQNYYSHSKITLMDGISYDFNEAVHVVITGNTGSGKSTALRYYLEYAYQLGDIVLIDPKKSDGARWARQHTNIKLVIPERTDRPEDFLPRVNDVLADVIRSLYERQDELYKHTSRISTDYRELGYRPKFIVIDEVASLTIGLKKSLLADFQALLTQISLLGRESGIFLILSMQEARHDLLPVPVRSQMGVRILLGTIDHQSAQFLFPELENGLPLPIGGKGSGIISINDGEHYGIEPLLMPTLIEKGANYDTNN